jgi:hypothetical protein
MEVDFKSFQSCQGGQTADKGMGRKVTGIGDVAEPNLDKVIARKQKPP